MKRRIFVLGAGFSAAYGYPTVEKLFEKIMEKAPEEKSKEILPLLSEYYPHFDVKYKNYPNIEEFLGFLQIDKEMSISTGRESPSPLFPQKPIYDHDRKKIEKIEKILTVLISKYFFEQLNQPLPSHLKNFCENLKEGDVIISFNWDLLLEKCLDEIGEKYSYFPWGDSSERNTKILILKPHGSINWIIADSKEEIEKFFKKEEFEDFGDGRTFGFKNFEYRKKQEDFIHCIIPPIPYKKFTFPLKQEEEKVCEKVPGHLEVIWRKIWFTLSEETEKIYFIGYSFPKYDFHIHYIFRNTFGIRICKEEKNDPNSVKVINPDFSVYTNYVYIFGKNFIFINSKFENINIKEDLFNQNE